MPFCAYEQIQSPVEACQLTIKNQAEIADKLAEALRLGQLSDLQMSVNSTNGCQEYVFRHTNETTNITLSLNDWLVQYPSGKLQVLSDAKFSDTYYCPCVDYAIPETSRKTVERALLDLINEQFPELYIGNATPTLTPYVTHTPNSAEGGSTVDCSIQDNNVIVAPKQPNVDLGSAMANTEVTITLPAPVEITRYTVAMEGDSYNAPKSWTVKASNTTELTGPTEIANVSDSDLKSGCYKMTEKMKADKFVFTFKNFEYDDQTVNKFRIALISGGELVEAPEPTPFDELTEDVLNLAKEKFISWYSVDDNKYTIALPTASMTSFSGISWILPILVNSSFVKSDTTISFNFTNNTITEGKYPNQFTTAALEGLVRELKCLPSEIRGRITEFNFASVVEESPSAIAASVTNNTVAHWTNFVTNVISVTAISQASQIKR